MNATAEGYSIKDKNGNYCLRKFENTLDWSLDTIKLEEEYWKATRRKDFYFRAGNKRYTQVVINIKFTYSYKEFNNSGKNTYVRAGYTLRDLEIVDGVCIRGGELLAIQTNVEVQNPVSSDVLGKYFAYVDGYYKQIGSIPVIKNKAELREELYQNGFVCDGIKYVRYKRSSGSSRVGKCLFVNEIVAERMKKWDRCGLNVKDGDEIDLAAYEAYIALPMSSIIDTIQIEPKNILLVDDYNSVFTDEVVAVEQENDKLVSARKKVEISNIIWDGESLMDKSMFGKYENKGMLLLRNRFFKTCAFNTNIQEFFEDNGITDISQLNGFTLAENIEDIKLITTPSSIKYLKFGTIRQWLKNIDSTFGIVKHEKETHFFDGRLVQSHYQLINTLQLSYEDVEEFLKPSLDYIYAVKKDPTVLRYHIGYAYREDEEEIDSSPYKTKNDVIFKMLGINDEFGKTKVYKEFRDNIIKGFYRNLRRGHVLLNGNYSTLLGNGVELLQYAINKFNGKSVLPENSIYSKRFEFGTKILGSRSPHVTLGNILLVNNASCPLIEKYFNLTKEIVYINSINENILQRLSGADMDSDTMLLTDNQTLIRAAEKNYDKYKVPTNLVESKKAKRFYTAGQQADLDVKTSVNKIGEIVNLSQQLNSLYWDRLYKGESYDNAEELYNDICKLDVLSGIEIDKAKKEFTIDSGKEIEALKNKYKIVEGDKVVKPMFFKMITLENGYELSENNLYKNFNTPMDYLQRIINSAKYKQARNCKTETISFMDIIRKPESDVKSGYYITLKNKIIDLVKYYKDQINRVYIPYLEKDKAGRKAIREEAAELKRKCMDIVESMSSHEYLMWLVLKELELKENRPIRNLMFEILFGKPSETFMCMLEKSKNTIYKLQETENGSEKYYDFNFERIKFR